MIDAIKNIFSLIWPTRTTYAKRMLWDLFVSDSTLRETVVMERLIPWLDHRTYVVWHNRGATLDMYVEETDLRKRTSACRTETVSDTTFRDIVVKLDDLIAYEKNPKGTFVKDGVSYFIVWGSPDNVRRLFVLNPAKGSKCENTLKHIEKCCSSVLGDRFLEWAKLKSRDRSNISKISESDVDKP